MTQTEAPRTIQEINDLVLPLLPQTEPFRFIDRIVEVDDNHITGTFTFDPKLDFYRGHFRDRPVTPGVILIETMAQTGVVAFGWYLILKENSFKVPENQYVTLFAECQVEFLKEVPPGARVTVKAEKLFFRRMKLKVNATLFLENGEIAATAVLGGMGVKQ